MLSLTSTARGAALSAGVALLAAPVAGAATLDATVTATAAKKRSCITRPVDGAATAQRSLRLADASLVRARLAGARGDWDLAVFDRRGDLVAGSAGFRGNELAEGYAPPGPLTVQACRRSGKDRTARLTFSSFRLPAESGERELIQLVRVSTPTRADKARLQSLDLDLTEHGGPGFVEVVLHGAADVATLRQARFAYSIQIPDLVARAHSNRRRDAQYRASVARSPLPSGRTDYRRLVDIEMELKTLAESHPDLVKPLVLPHKSLEGRTIHGIEITENARAADGKPVFLQMGVHHSREWPSAEMPMEFANDLINGFGSDERTTRLMKQTRTIVVPVVNVDGYNLSREAAVDFRGVGPVDRPFIDATKDATDGTVAERLGPTHSGFILAEANVLGTMAYKRRNCRVTDGAVPAPGECARRENRNRGTDPNRNYGGFWGGPGASSSRTSDTYRGAGPFSEPEVQNVRALVSERQVTTLITNHTYSNLVLRPPGLFAAGPTPDEGIYKALSDAMADENGYTSQPSYELYDTTGTTEDWSYYATGGLGYTFEIGPYEFHPPYEDVVQEYNGGTAAAGEGGGNREAYFVALENTADASKHSVVTGRAKPGTTLRLEKSFTTLTSPVRDTDGDGDRDALAFEDRLSSTLPVGGNGRFEWHVNPSTRPLVSQETKDVQLEAEPARTDTYTTTEPSVPGGGGTGSAHMVDQAFEVKETDPRDGVKIRAHWVSKVNDFDMFVYREGAGGRLTEVGRSQNTLGDTNYEEVLLIDPQPGRYIVRLQNWASAEQLVTVDVSYFRAGSRTVTPGQKESWTLTCERRGRVLAVEKVVVDRGQRVDAGRVCDGR